MAAIVVFFSRTVRTVGVWLFYIGTMLRLSWPQGLVWSRQHRLPRLLLSMCFCHLLVRGGGWWQPTDAQKTLLLTLEQCSFLISAVMRCMASPDPCLIMGDLNASHRGWSSRETDVGAVFSEWFMNAQLVPLNAVYAKRVPTRPRSGLAIDLAVCPRHHAHRIQLFSVDSHVAHANSDHYPITVELANRDGPIISDDVRPALRAPRVPNWAGMRTMIDRMLPCWLENSEMLAAESTAASLVNSMANSLTSVLVTAAEVHMFRPKAGIKPVRHQLPLSVEIKDACRERHRILRALSRTGTGLNQANAVLQDRVRVLSDRIEKQLKELSAKRAAACIGSCVDASGQVSWSDVRRAIGSTATGPVNVCHPVSKQRPTSIRDSLQNVANVFNEVLHPHGPPRPLPEDESEALAWLSPDSKEADLCPAVTEEEVRMAIKSLNLKTAPGPDEVPAAVFSEASPLLVSCLSKLFTVSVQHGVLPDCWKEAHVSCIHKSGSSSDGHNFRPVSVTSVMARVLEYVQMN